MVVEFGLFGQVEARIGGEPVDLGHLRQRCVLAALLIDANRVVPVDRLVDRVWGDRAPSRARGTIYSYLSRLRRALAPAADEVRLIRRHGGYVVEVEPSAVDLHRFRRLLEQARAAGGAAEAAALLERALDLWRGDAFATLDSPWFNSWRQTVQGERIAAELDLGDVRLQLGQHARLVSEFSARAQTHPLDERLAAQLMLALYRSGRAAEALAHYQCVRKRLAEELGTDPGAALRTLYQRILAEDPVLSAPAPGPAARVPTPSTGPAPEQAPTPAPDPAPTTATASVPATVPRQLPPPTPLFVGRAHKLAELDKVLGANGGTGGTMALSTIGGTGGIGKTWLAVHWAHRNAEAFPDGQLYADLRGFAVSAEPVPPAEVVLGFLHALGVGAEGVPVDLPSRAALFRSLVAGKRMLIVLDNARDTEQVVPLLPGTPSCMVLVTSRNQLVGLITAYGARPLPLDVLTEAEARELLSRYLGAERTAREPEAVAALTRHCAGLPLAISLVAARATTHPGFPLSVLADELRSRTARLDALDTHDLTADLRAVFSSSYRALEPPAARMFGLLGRAPVPEVSVAAATALAALPAPATRSLLRGLEAAHLVHEHCPGRYRMHDLVRLYASERGERDQPQADLDAALRRLTDFYARTAHAGDRLLSPQRTPFAAERPGAAPAPHPLTDAAAAMEWFDAEHACLLELHRFTIERGRDKEPGEGWGGWAWHLAWSLDTYQWRRGHLDDRTAVLRATLEAPGALGDPAARALAHRLLGRAQVPLEQRTEALDNLRRALALFGEAGDAAGQAQTNLNLALAWEQRGDDRRALSHAIQNLRLRRRLDGPLREAEALNAVGWYLARLGHHGQARHYCEQALALSRRLGFREGEAFTLDSLGYLAHHGGRPAQALDHYRQALALRRELGDAYEEADALACLGDVHRTMGQPARAAEAWRQALSLYRSQHRLLQVARLEEKLSRPAGEPPTTRWPPGSG